MNNLIFTTFYVAAVAVVILHFTGTLSEHGLEWLVHVIAVLVFPVVLVF